MCCCSHSLLRVAIIKLDRIKMANMLLLLLLSDQEAAMAREQLEKDLHSTKAQLRENHHVDGSTANEVASSADYDHSHMSPEHDVSAW